MPLTVRGGVIAPTEAKCSNCDLKAKCQFHQPRMGGFKGTRPHYVGVRIVTDQIENHNAADKLMTCKNFVETLQDRMLIGRQLREQGKDGEIIRVIAQEGEMFNARTRVGVNAAGEIVRPPSEIQGFLKKAGHKIATNDHSNPVTWREVKFEMPVPSYVDVADRVNSYSDEILRDEMKYQNAAHEADQEAFKIERERMAAADAEVLKVSKRNE